MELLQRAYDAFNARDIDAALSLMQPDVDWPNGFEGGREHGHEAVREYWTRQWAQVDSHVEPLSFTEAPDGRVVVAVQQTIRELDGTVRGESEVRHVYTLRDGLVARMDIVTQT
jgi:hypothetical protein